MPMTLSMPPILLSYYVSLPFGYKQDPDRGLRKSLKKIYKYAEKELVVGGGDK